MTPQKNFSAQQPFERVGLATGLYDGTRFTSTIFEEMSILATTHQAINLGQGFPDTDGPQSILDAAAQAMAQGINQYAPISGRPELRAAIAEHQQRFYGQSIDPETQVLVTAGASEAISATVAALVQPGDEVVVFEPYYDIYPATVALAGGTVRTVPLTAPEFAPQPEDLAQAFSDKTRLVIVNDPHNPTGTVFSRETLQEIVQLAQQHHALILQDGVYEHLVFEPTRFTPIFTVEGAAERTLFVSAISKTHSLTGWRIGWLTGPAQLIEQIKVVKGYFTHSAAAPLQIGAATGLRLPEAFYTELNHRYTEQRSIVINGLSDTAFKLAPVQGTFFAAANVQQLLDHKKLSSSAELAALLPQEAGVGVVPMTAFVQEPQSSPMKHWIRFAFCKRPDVLHDAIARLKEWEKQL